MGAGAMLARGGSAIGAAPASDGGSLCPSSTALGAGCGSASHGADAVGAGALTNSRSSSESARGAAVGERRVSVAVGGSLVCARSAIGAAPASDGDGCGVSSAVLDAGDED